MSADKIQKKTFRFSTRIRAPRERVAATMFEDAGFRAWTKPFCEGSYFEGSWEKGARIRFLTPTGEGMVAEIAEHRPAEFVSIRHLGQISDGVEDTTSDEVLAWAPAHENYSFADRDGETEVSVELETQPQYMEFLEKAYVEGFEISKQMCEGAAESE